jgi:DNA-binding MarR family transcriptional regulator
MEPRDSVDEHLDRWLPLRPDLDPVLEAAVTRMAFLARHLHRVKERGLARHQLQESEYSTLKALAARRGRAVPSELVADLRVSPAAMTGRLDTLEQRGFVQRTPSAVDRRRVDVKLTPAGYDAWRAAVSVVGREEERIFAALSPADRKRLADLLRRLLVLAESSPGGA